MFEKIVSIVNDIVWNPLLVVLLVGAGLYFSIRTRFVQVRRFGLMIRSLFAKAEKDESGNKHGISSFQAFCIALSGRVGTGNIVGVATAIALGGPGAVFWMWLIAFFGASTAFVESTLAQLYKFKHSTGFRGGPSSYIEHGLGKPGLGVLFSILAIVGYGILLPTVQANGVAGALTNSFELPSLAAGLGMAFLLALVIIGGVKSISRVASVITPFMALGYIIFSIIIIFQHIDVVPAVLKSIVVGAFGIKPVAGGILGSTIMMGVKRGIFSNEAGQGSGAMVSAAAAVSHRRSVTDEHALARHAKTGEMLVAQAPELGANYVGFTQAAVDSAFTGFGSAFVSIALLFFAFTTVMAYYFYTESSIIYLFSGRNGSVKTERTLIWCYRFLLLAMVVFGSLREANVVWQLGDIGVGLTAWINVLSLLILCPHAIKALEEYESRD